MNMKKTTPSSPSGKVLVLDDDRGVLELMRTILRTIPSVEMVHALDDPQRALVLASQNDYDLIVSDINFSSGSCGEKLADGLRFVEEILSIKGSDTLKKIIVVSSDYERIEEASRMGVHCLKKPFEVSEFRTCVQNIIAGKTVAKGQGENFN